MRAYNERMPGTDPMKPASPGVRLTYDDFVRFPDDGQRHELIGGEHYVTPSPNTRHQRLVGRLHLLIANHLERHPVGEVFVAPFDVVFSRFDVVEPDLIYVSRERASAILTDAHVRGAPDLVIEIGSPGTRQRDKTIKRQLYERSGVEEYWFIDPESDVVEVHRLAGDRFERVGLLRLETADVLRTPLLPGLELPLARVLGT